jgi:hypothetical protein
MCGFTLFERSAVSDHDTKPDYAEWQLRIQDEMQALRAKLEENTAITQEVRDVLDAIKTGMRAVNWLGAATKWIFGLGASIAVIWAATHGGKTP